MTPERLRRVAAALCLALWTGACAAPAPVVEDDRPPLPPVPVQIYVTGPVPEEAADKSKGVKFSLRVMSISIEISGPRMNPVFQVIDVLGPQGVLLVDVPASPGPDRLVEAIGYSRPRGEGQEIYRGTVLNVNIPPQGGIQVPVAMQIVGGLAPEVSVDLPKWATESEALLQGFVNPNGVETEVVFEWGTTPALGQTTAPIKTLPAVNDQRVEARLTGLASASTYFYRMRATGRAGKSETEVRYFKSQPAEGESFMRDLIHIQVRPGLKRDQVDQVVGRYGAFVLESSIDNYILKYTGSKSISDVVHAMNEDAAFQFAQVMPFFSRLKK
jgi:hypothetical protein